MHRSIRDTIEYLGDELPIFEAEYATNPWGPERGDVQAWNVASDARASKNQKPSPFRYFDVTREPGPAVQPLSEAKRQLQQAAAQWPGAGT